MTKLVLIQETEKRWRLEVNGKRHGSTFINTKDFQEWLGMMQAHGLYTDAIAISESSGGTTKKVEPTYKYVCQMPTICCFA